MGKPRGPAPFADGEPVLAAALERMLDPDGKRQRRDGPTPAGTPSSSGGARAVPQQPATGSYLQALEDILTDDWLWEAVEEMEAPHSNQSTHGRRRGRPREYKLMDTLTVELASFLYDGYSCALRNLSDPKTWRPLKKALKKAFPNDPSRRLSKKAPSRSQHYRARRDYFRGVALSDLCRRIRKEAVDTAVEMGMFDPSAGSFTKPDKSQCIMGDATWMHSATNQHHSRPFHPVTGKVRRFDPDAEHFHNVDGTRSKIPGRGVVILACRNAHHNERVILDMGFMPRAYSAENKGRNDSDVAIDMLGRLLDENGDLLRAGLRGFIYDMALDSEGIDDILDMRILPITKTPRTNKGRYRYANLGPHQFTAADGTSHELVVYAIDGSHAVRLTNSKGDDLYVPLRRNHIRWGSEGKKRSIAWCDAHIPTDAPASHLRGATVSIRLNSTEQEIHSKPHTRRTRAARAIPESDPAFKVYGAREDIESINGHLKHQLRGRLRSTNEDGNRFNLLAYQIQQLGKAKSAYRKRITSTQAVPIAA